MSTLQPLPTPAQRLVEQVRDRLYETCADAPFAIASKGASEDVIDGLSDIDFRFVLDTRDPEIWHRATGAFADVFIKFAHENPQHWRLIEHLPATAYRPEELIHPPVCWERTSWSLLYESSDSVLPTTFDSGHNERAWHIRSLLGYKPPYDARRDPPINVRPEYLSHFETFSICWHFYAPAMRAIALALGYENVRSKWGALRWRAEQGVAVADEVLTIASKGFVADSSVLAHRCAQDIELLASELAGAENPWPLLEQQAMQVDLSTQERLFATLALARTYPDRWRFYIGVPEGYDLRAVLKIDRGHIGNYCLRYLNEDSTAMRELFEFGPDGPALQDALDFLMTQHTSTDYNNPREAFHGLREKFIIVRSALEAWDASR